MLPMVIALVILGVWAIIILKNDDNWKGPKTT